MVQGQNALGLIPISACYLPGSSHLANPSLNFCVSQDFWLLVAETQLELACILGRIYYRYHWKGSM